MGKVQTDYEKAETRFTCHEAYDRRQIRLVRENYKQLECGFWQGDDDDNDDDIDDDDEHDVLV